MPETIDDIIEKNRRDINIVQKDTSESEVCELGQDETPPNTTELSYGQEFVIAKSTSQYQGTQQNTDLRLTNQIGEFIGKILSGDNSKSVVKHSVGEGLTTTERRNVESLADPSTVQSESHNLSISGNTLIIESDIYVPDKSKVTEVGLELSDGSIIQYFEV